MLQTANSHHIFKPFAQTDDSDMSTCWSNMLQLNKSTFMNGWKPTTNQYKTLYDQLFHNYFDYPTEIEETIRSLNRPLQWFPPQWFEHGKMLPSGRMGQVYIISCRIPHQRQRNRMILREINLCMLQQKKLAIPKEVIGITAIRFKHHYKLALVSPAMEHSLEQLIPQVDQWTFQKTCRISILIASCVRDLHQSNGVHPNLQPKNILVSNIYDEHELKLKIVDGQDDWSSIPLSSRYGRWPYISPEISYEFATLNQASNIYALGIILWQLASGVIFPNTIAVCPTVYEINTLKHVDPAYQNIITRCLSKNPNNRPSAETVCELLTGVLMTKIVAKKRDAFHTLRVNAIRDRQIVISKYLAQCKPFHASKKALQDLMEGASLSKRMMIQVTISLERHWQEDPPIPKKQPIRRFIPAEIKYHANENIYYDASLPDLIQMGYA